MDNKDIKDLNINEKILSIVNNGIIITDDKLRIYSYNKWLESYTGIKECNILNRYLYDVFDINIIALTRKIKTALIIGAPTFYAASTSNYLIPIKIDHLKISDFTYMQQDVSIVPFDKKTNLVALIITDQTNIIEANNQLKKNILKVKELNNELTKEREIIDKKVFFIKFNNQYLITDISQAYLKLIQYEKDELLNHDFFFFERLHITKKLKNKILKKIDEKKVFKFEIKTLNKKGKEFWMINTLVPEYDINGNHLGFILFRDDITDAKKVLNHQKKLLINSRNAAMGEMISMIAHQWRQPLSLINTLIATLKIKQELKILNEETIKNSFDKMEKTVQYLSDTIDDFRNFLKPNKILSEVSLYTIFNKSTMLLKEEIKHLNIKYIQNFDENITIQTYENELIQSIINILKNSIDAFDNKNMDKYISVNIKKEKTHIFITIEDNAGGIKSKIINKIFEPYFSTKSKNGTGLGLYMCKIIIENHLNGRISIKSRNNNNTKTIIELPYLIKEIM